MAQAPNSGSLLSSGLLRFSIRQLLIWTAVIALGCVALRSASAGWVAAILAIVLLILATATLLAVFRQGADRAQWIGFGVFGWLYWLLLMFGQLDGPGQLDNPFWPRNFATAKLSALLYDRLYSEPRTHYGMGGADSMMGPMSGMGGMPGSGSVSAITGPSRADFINVAHSLWTLLLAACGGWLARWIYATGPAAKKEASDLAAPNSS